MGDPEFRSDEQVLVRTKGIHVKSIPFEGILTSRRIILVDRAKNILPTKEIPLATIKEVATGENALRDQILTLSVMAKTGETRQMILTFSGQDEEHRSRERDEWAHLIQESTSPSFEHVIRKVIPGADQAQKRTGSSVPPRIEVVNAPSTQYTATPVKRVIGTRDAAAPVAGPAVRQFDELSPGESVFCNRCGNRVSTDSAFCNRCGSPIMAPASAAPQAVPRQYAATPAPVHATERPPGGTPAEAKTRALDISLQQSLAWDEEPAPEPVSESRHPAAKQPAQKPAKKGFLSGLFGPKKQRGTSPVRAQPGAAGTPVPPKKPRNGRSFMPGKKTLIAIGAVIVVILVVAVAALFVYPMLNKGSSESSSGTISSSGTSTSGSSTSSSSTLTNSGVASITVKETTAPIIPATGVYVSINYVGSWKGTYGMPSDLQTAIDSGDRYYEIVNATGQVTAAFQKQDSSKKHDLTVDIYRNGAVLATNKTSDAFGKVIVSANVTTGVAQAASSTTAAAATGNTTVTAKPTTIPVTNTTIKKS